jgi:hypothetical protein
MAPPTEIRTVNNAEGITLSFPPDGDLGADVFANAKFKGWVTFVAFI